MTDSASLNPPERVRITASGSLGDHGVLDSGAHVDPRSFYVTSLIRAQLRLALYSLAGFLGLLTAFVLILISFPELDQWSPMGISLRWWLLGVGVYPLIFVTAVIYAGAARRNESRYLQLIGETES